MEGGSFGVSQLRGGGWGFLDGEDLWSSGDGIRDQEGGGGARGVLSGGRGMAKGVQIWHRVLKNICV